jgi:hypothetical protein
MPLLFGRSKPVIPLQRWRGPCTRLCTTPIATPFFTQHMVQCSRCCRILGRCSPDLHDPPRTLPGPSPQHNTACSYVATLHHLTVRSPSYLEHLPADRNHQNNHQNIYQHTWSNQRTIGRPLRDTSTEPITSHRRTSGTNCLACQTTDLIISKY